VGESEVVVGGSTVGRFAFSCGLRGWHSDSTRRIYRVGGLILSGYDLGQKKRRRPQKYDAGNRKLFFHVNPATSNRSAHQDWMPIRAHPDFLILPLAGRSAGGKRSLGMKT
jgi:hypothetical protein